MDILRTPDERFARSPRLALRAALRSTPAALRVHYVDEGPRDARAGAPHARRAVVGLPLPQDDPGASSAAGHRVGRARPRRLRALATSRRAREDYTYQRHVDWMAAVLDGARSARHHARLPGLGRAHRPAARRRARRSASRASSPPTRSCRRATRRSRRRVPRLAGVLAGDAEVLPVGKIVNAGCARRRSRPRSSRPTTRRSPTSATRPARGSSRCSCPTRPDDPASAANRAAWESLERFEKPFLTAFSDSDPDHARRRAARCRRSSPARRGKPHVTIAGAGHFLQEDAGEELARVVVDFMSRTKA